MSPCCRNGDRMRKGTKILAGISLALLSLGITFYPLISNYFAEFNRSLVETKYTKAVQLMDDDGVNEARMAAQEYNATLLSGAYKPYTKEALSQAAEGYNDLLNIRGDGIMGYIEIPKLGVELPVFHGTEEETLDRGLGHLLGSSLPVGGIGTHCVIAGHSGLAGQRMFSDLEKLKIMDVFYLKVLNETMAYAVVDINTVLPEDTSKLTVDPHGDHVTLVTCTPYGINTHRLLVCGTRIGYETAAKMVEDDDLEEAASVSTWKSDYLRGVILGLIGIVFSATMIGSVRTMASRRHPDTKLKPPARHMGKPAPLFKGRRKRGKHEAP